MRALAGLTAAASLLSAPLSAQDSPGSNQGFTPEEDLDCAMYIASVMGEGEGEMSPGETAGLTAVLTYFIGRYEAQRGHLTPQVMLSHFALYQQRDPRELQQTCTIRASNMGDRLSRIGRVMVEEGSSQKSPQKPE